MKFETCMAGECTALQLQVNAKQRQQQRRGADPVGMRVLMSRLIHCVTLPGARAQ